jgi:hypothetical protein
MWRLVPVPGALRVAGVIASASLNVISPTRQRRVPGNSAGTQSKLAGFKDAGDRVSVADQTA